MTALKSAFSPKSAKITGPLVFTSHLNKRIQGLLRKKAGRKNIFEVN
jgi:hypothetical protein